MKSLTLGNKKFQEISKDDEPSDPSWKFPDMYKTDQKGKIRKWAVRFDHTTNSLIMEFGFKDNTRLTSRKVVPRSVRSMKEQALLEMRKRYTDKERDGYTTEIEEPSETTTNFGGAVNENVKLQLANKYDPSGPKKIRGYPVLIQPKLDGIRSYALIEDGQVKMKSRKHIEFPWLDHIKKDLAKVFDKLPSGSVLDGELYVHDKTFQQLSSIIRKRKTKHEENEEIIYMVFDIILDLPFEERIKILEEHVEQENVSVVSTIQAETQSEIDTAHDHFVQQGYEGVMIRHISTSIGSDKYKKLTLYKGGRNNNLLKYKKFHEEEGKILDIVEASGTEKGAALFKLEDPRGNVFTTRPMGDFENRINIFNNKEQYIGKKVTYSYQTLSDEGVPIFAVAKEIRDYES